MSPFWSALLALFLDAFGKAAGSVVTGWLQTGRTAADERQLGAATASSATLQDVAEIADAQAKNNAMDRGGAGDVARRLHHDLEPESAGDGAG